MNLFTSLFENKLKFKKTTIVFILLIFVINLTKLFAESNLQSNIKIIEVDKDIIQKFGLKKSDKSFEIPVDVLSNSGKMQKIVVNNKAISVKNLKKNENFNTEFFPRLVVYKFLNGSTIFFKYQETNDKDYSLSNSNERFESNLISKNNWFALHTKIKEKNGKESDVWIWYDNEILEENENQSNNSQDISKNKRYLIKNLFPNPASNQCTLILDLEITKNLSIRIFDINGNKVLDVIPETMELTAGIKEFRFNVDSLPVGMYFLNVQSSSGDSEVSRLIIMK